MSKSPGHVVLHLYHPKNKRHEQYHGLVVSSRELEGKEHPVLTVIYFDHLDTAAHHALNGVDWAETLDRVLDVPHEADVEGAPFFYEDVDSGMEAFATRMYAALDERSKQLRAAQVELAEVKLKYASVPPTETKRYADGSSATGPAPLPDHSPEGAPALPSAADLDKVAEEEKVKEATAGKPNGRKAKPVASGD